MGKVGRSAVYFSRTKEVDEFLAEFIRVRTWYVENPNENSVPINPTVPYQRRKPAQPSNSASLDKVEHDSLLCAAREMTEGSSINLDAFISLNLYYADLVDNLDREETKIVKPKHFELHKVMKHAKVKERKASTPTINDDIKSVLREAEEKRYQRLVADLREKHDDKTNGIAGAKPPIIGGINFIFGLPLTFIGGYSIAGALGVKDNITRVIVGIVSSLLAILVDTFLFVMRSGQ